VGLTIDPADQDGTLWFTFTNSSAAAVTFTVKANAYRADGPWTYQVPAGESARDFWHAGTYGNGWYDMTVTATGDAAWSQRFVGHIETGTESVSG